MAARRGPEVYRGRRKKLNLAGIIAGAVVALILLVVVLFFGLQKYIVFGHEGISVSLPGAGAGEDGGVGAESELEQVSAALEIAEPDYSAVPARAGEGLGDFIAVYVPAADVSLTGVGRYVEIMDSYNANALVLEVKPAGGQLVWRSSSSVAASFGTAGTVDISTLVAALKEQDIYLVAQLSCCVDGLLAQRSPTSALALNTGASYADTDGAWLNPYSETVSQYIVELCEELIAAGFDELLLQNLAMPITDAPIGYTVQLSSTPTPEAAVCGLAMTVSNALADYDVPVSAVINGAGLRSGQSAQSGQNVELFAKVFDRLCTVTDSGWLSGVDRDSMDQYFELGDPAQRYAPICSYAPDGFPTAIVQVPENVLPSADSGEEEEQ